MCTADSSGLFSVDGLSMLEDCGPKASEVEFNGNLFRRFLPEFDYQALRLC
jgi:hypothetical protein